MKRLDWLRDRVTQMGHHPDLYERWHAEIEKIEEGGDPSKRQHRRMRAFAAAGLPDGHLPPGMIYCHGAVITEAEARIISDQMTAMGSLKPPDGSARYYQLAAAYLRIIRRAAA